MRRTAQGWGLAALVAAGLLSMTHAEARRSGGGDLFEDIAGTWGGGGTVTTSNGGVERLRCRATYSPSGPSALSLSIRCASDSFKLEVQSNVAREGGRVSGNWREASFGVSGDITGSVAGDQLTARIDGMGLTARLSINVRGNSQTFTLSADSTGTASVVLHRE